MGVKIFILVGDVSYNRGDLGSVYSQIAQIKKIWPDAEITFSTLNPELHRKWFDAKIIRQSVFINRQQLKAMREADIISWGGGALVADHSCKTLVPYWFLMLFFIRFILRKKVVAVSHGVVLKTKLGKFLARTMYNWVEAIGARDVSSYNTIKQLGVKTPVTLTGDYAMLLKPSASLSAESLAALEGKQGDDVICVTLTFWHLYNTGKDILPYFFRRRLGFYKNRKEPELERLKQGLAQLADKLIEKHGGYVRFIPRYPNPNWDDVKHLHAIKALSKYPGKILLLEAEHVHPAEYPLILKAHKYVISIPLHDAIFASVAAAPLVTLPYESKVSDFARAVNVPYIDWLNLFSPEGVAAIANENAVTADETKLAEIRQNTLRNILLLKGAI